jgi:hypothetical protein
MEQKQKIVILMIPVLVFCSIIMTEMKLWSSINLENIHTVIEILVPALNLLAILLCVRFYRTFNNPYFKFQSIVLAIGIVNAGLYELPAIISRHHLFYNSETTLYQIVSTSIGPVRIIISLAGILLALYALLKYRERCEQDEVMPLVKRFKTLLPGVQNSRLFWPVAIGVPLLLNLPLVLSSIPISLTVLFTSLFSTASLVAQLLGLLLCLALGRVYGNNFFKYMAAGYIISLGVIVFSCLYGISGLFFHRFWVSPPTVCMLINITFTYIVVFHKILITGILVFALFTYREQPGKTSESG